MARISPITYQIVYGISDIKYYVEDCKEEDIIPSQEGFTKHVRNCFSCMLEEYAQLDSFTEVQEGIALDTETGSLFLLRAANHRGNS